MGRSGWSGEESGQAAAYVERVAASLHSVHASEATAASVNDGSGKELPSALPGASTHDDPQQQQVSSHGGAQQQDLEELLLLAEQQQAENDTRSVC